MGKRKNYFICEFDSHFAIGMSISSEYSTMSCGRLSSVDTAPPSSKTRHISSGTHRCGTSPAPSTTSASRNADATCSAQKYAEPPASYAQHGEHTTGGAKLRQYATWLNGTSRRCPHHFHRFHRFDIAAFVSPLTETTGNALHRSFVYDGFVCADGRSLFVLNVTIFGGERSRVHANAS